MCVFGFTFAYVCIIFYYTLRVFFGVVRFVPNLELALVYFGLFIFCVAFCTFEFIESAQVISTENCSIYKLRFEAPSFVHKV